MGWVGQLQEWLFLLSPHFRDLFGSNTSCISPASIVDNKHINRPSSVTSSNRFHNFRRSLTYTGVLAAGSLLSLLLPSTDSAIAKHDKEWVGNGIPVTLKKLHQRMLNWEFVDLTELGDLDKWSFELDPRGISSYQVWR